MAVSEGCALIGMLLAKILRMAARSEGHGKLRRVDATLQLSRHGTTVSALKLLEEFQYELGNHTNSSSHGQELAYTSGRSVDHGSEARCAIGALASQARKRSQTKNVMAMTISGSGLSGSAPCRVPQVSTLAGCCELSEGVVPLLRYDAPQASLEVTHPGKGSAFTPQVSNLAGCCELSEGVVPLLRYDAPQASPEVTHPGRGSAFTEDGDIVTSALSHVYYMGGT